jgi:hypothetical protein
MVRPDWSAVRRSLKAAIRDALTLETRKVKRDRVAGFGVDMDTYYGSAGTYLLPESAARAMEPALLISLGDWPISTHWDHDGDDAIAFRAHWGTWEDWFHKHADDFDEVGEEKGWALMRATCEAVRELDISGSFDKIPKTQDFKIIVADHDDSNEFAAQRYGLFVRTGVAFCDRPIVFREGSTEILGQVRMTKGSLVLELAQIDGGDEGILPTIWGVAEEAAKKKGLGTVEWIIHAMNCGESNPNLCEILDTMGLVAEDIPCSGKVYRLITDVKA